MGSIAEKVKQTMFLIPDVDKRQVEDLARELDNVQGMAIQGAAGAGGPIVIPGPFPSNPQYFRLAGETQDAYHWQGKGYFQYSDNGSTLVTQIDDAGYIFNEAGSDIDFRIEGDSDTQLFNLDAGSDVIAMGGAVDASFKLAVHGQQLIDHTSTEALLVRKNADGGDVFLVDTTNSEVEITGDLDVSVHAAIGNAATLSANNVLAVQETFTDPAATKIGGFLRASVDITANNAQTIYGFFGYSTIAIDTFNHTGALVGVYGQAQLLSGSETLATAEGGRFFVSNVTAGTIAFGYGARVLSAQNSGGGAITTVVGLLVDSQTTGDTNYSVYTGAGTVSLGDSISFRQAATISTTAGDLTLNPAVNINIDSDLDLSAATRNVTLNAAVDALNFDSNTLSIDASNNRVGIGGAAPTEKLDVEGNVNLGNAPVTSANSLNRGYYVYKSGATAYGMKLQYSGGEFGTMIFGPNQGDRFIAFGKVGAVLEDDDMTEYARFDLDNGRLGIAVTAPSAMIHVDQLSSTGAVPVLFLDQGDVSEQIIKASYSGADVDMTIIELDVTGAPKFGWSETPNVFTLNKGLTITGTLDTDGFIGNTVEKSSGYTATASDFAIMCDASGGGFTITLPAAASHTGRVYHIKKIDSSGNIVTVDGNSSETIDDATTAVLTAQYEAITIQSDGDEWFIL